MAAFAVIAAAFLGQLALSRALLVLLRRMGDTATRIYLAHGVTFVIATLGLAWLSRNGGPPPVLQLAVLNLGPLLVLATIDILRLMRRRAKHRDAMYISRMR